MPTGPMSWCTVLVKSQDFTAPSKNTPSWFANIQWLEPFLDFLNVIWILTRASISEIVPSRRGSLEKICFSLNFWSQTINTSTWLHVTTRILYSSRAKSKRYLDASLFIEQEARIRNTQYAIYAWCCFISKNTTQAILLSIHSTVSTVPKVPKETRKERHPCLCWLERLYSTESTAR